MIEKELLYSIMSSSMKSVEHKILRFMFDHVYYIVHAYKVNPVVTNYTSHDVVVTSANTP